METVANGVTGLVASSLNGATNSLTLGHGTDLDGCVFGTDGLPGTACSIGHGGKDISAVARENGKDIVKDRNADPLTNTFGGCFAYFAGICAGVSTDNKGNQTFSIGAVVGFGGDGTDQVNIGTASSGGTVYVGGCAEPACGAVNFSNGGKSVTPSGGVGIGAGGFFGVQFSFSF